MRLLGQVRLPFISFPALFAPSLLSSPFLSTSFLTSRYYVLTSRDFFTFTQHPILIVCTFTRIFVFTLPSELVFYYG